MNFYTVSQTSLAHSGSSVVESYIPLWFADGTSISSNTTTRTFVEDGGGTQNSVTSSIQLHTLNSNWQASQKFAFEATIWNYSSGITTTVSLYDLTGGTATIISGSTVTTTSTTATVIRSPQFALTPGHVYGVGISTSNSSYNAYMSDASLIVFGS